MPTVVVANAVQGIKPAIEAIFAPYGGVEAVIPKTSVTVYVKPNAVHFTPHTHTDPRVLEALLGYLRDHGYTRLAVMESCTGGNFTRLVFNRTGKACPEAPPERVEGRSRRDNGDAHLNRRVMGREVVVATTDGRLDDPTELVEVFGPWEQIFGASRNGWHVSLDGRRRKCVLLKIIRE